MTNKIKLKIGDKLYASTSIGVAVRIVSKIITETFDNNEIITYFYYPQEWQRDLVGSIRFEDYVPMCEAGITMAGHFASAQRIANNLMPILSNKYRPEDRYWRTEIEARNAFKAWKKEDMAIIPSHTKRVCKIGIGKVSYE